MTSSPVAVVVAALFVALLVLLSLSLFFALLLGFSLQLPKDSPVV